jgi:leucyl/phenylalanyl-tRNA--protein transferase
VQRPIQLDDRLWFPDPERATTGPYNGLLAIGGDLSVRRLLLAYRSGIFPWTADPITWWSPDPRAILELDGLHVPRSLERVIRQGRFEITVNRAFREVMEGCADPCRPGGWISAEFIEAYTALHQAGYANSLECWQAGQLAGGIYGIAIGGFFAGESMFHRTSDASKVALFHLIQRLRERAFKLFDIQMTTPITKRLGGVEIARSDYLRRLREAVTLDCRF